MNTINSLKNYLADTYGLMMKTHTYHWNVKGSGFGELHAMFGQQYESLFAVADKIAERIRALGDEAPGGFKSFLALTCLDEPKTGASADQMLLDLITDHRKLVLSAKGIIKTAMDYDDEATANIMAERIEDHEKHIWMLNSSL